MQDGKSVVSGSYDETVRVWDAATGKEVQKLEGHSEAVSSVAFSQVRALSIAREAVAGAVVGGGTCASVLGRWWRCCW